MDLWHAQNISYMMNIMTAKFHVNNVCGLGKKIAWNMPPTPPPSHLKWSWKSPGKVGLNYFTDYEKWPGSIKANFVGCVLGIW